MVEIAMGVLLLFVRCRTTGIVVAITSHIFILIFLSPFGISQNTVVYPWNVAMMFVVVLAFFNTDNKIIDSQIHLRIKWLHYVGIVLVWIMPSLNFFGRWDNYLSFSLYSDKSHIFYIAIEESEIIKIDKQLHKYFVTVEGMTGGRIIDVNRWSMKELNVPFYPETRVFRELGESFCHLGIPDEKLIFLEFEKPLTKNKFTSFTCNYLRSTR